MAWISFSQLAGPDGPLDLERHEDEQSAQARAMFLLGLYGCGGWGTEPQLPGRETSTPDRAHIQPASPAGQSRKP